MTTKEAMEMALEALEGGGDSWRLIGPAIDALKTALEQPEPFQPDWDRIEPLQEALREHMAEIHRKAAELRRLHAVNQELLEVVQKYIAWSEAENDHKETTFWERVEMCREVDAIARAASAKAEGQA